MHMFRHEFSIQSLILLLALYIPLASNAQWEDQHSTEALVAALQSAMPDHAVSEARDFDDQLMATGELEGSKVYLVTDARSIRVNTMVRKLLAAMEEDSDHWVVRVLDTDPPVENAFVTGGKYIYVFTGLIEKASGDDELAFVLGHELGHSLLQHNERRDDLENAGDDDKQEDGSIMMIVATDAPLNARSLDRLAMRAIMGLARTGSFASNGSGDYVISFSTDPGVRRPRQSDVPVRSDVLVNESMSPLFAATAEATEEAIYNAIFKATTVSSSRGTLEAIPIDKLMRILEKHHVLGWDTSQRP